LCQLHLSAFRTESRVVLLNWKIDQRG
jgi:hypothetical protein